MNYLEKARELASQERFEDAILLLKNAEKSNLIYPEILVLQSIYMQLLEKNEKYTLKDAENCLHNALVIDNNYINALVELGHLYFVENKTKEAEKCFDKVILICNKIITDAVITKAKCIEENEDETIAIDYLKNVNRILVNNDKINDLINEFKEYHN